MPWLQPFERAPFRKSEKGFTFVENLIAMMIVVLFFAALFGVNSQGLYLLNSGAGSGGGEDS